MARLGLTAAPERLVPFTRWITPLGVRRRFDTRFYVVRAPRQQVMPGDGRGVRLAVGDGRRGPGRRGRRAGLRDATILELVAPVTDAGALLRRLRGRVEQPPVMPRIVEELGQLTVADDAAPLFR